MNERERLIAVAGFAAATLQKAFGSKGAITGLTCLDDDELREMIGAANGILDAALPGGIGKAPMKSVRLFGGWISEASKRNKR